MRAEKGTWPKREDTLILAYGSNLLWQRLSQRCPGAEAVGCTWITGYRMLFKESKTGAFATIEQDANCSVPAVAYLVSMEDEARLDRCEGYPKYYYKREFFLPIWKMDGKRLRGRRECVAYVLHEDRLLGEPSQEYYSIIEKGYADWGFDRSPLEKALSDSIGEKAAVRWLKQYRKGESH